MFTLKVRYDGEQHVTATREPCHNVVEIDCPYTGKGEEFSPASLFTVSLASCMLLAMGAIAQRDGLDLGGTVVDASFSGMGQRVPQVETITLVFDIPMNFMPSDRRKLERAAGLCPIMGSLGPDIRVETTFNFGVADKRKRA